MARWGRYELGEVLGEGGFGQVHAATLHATGGLRIPVALKILEDGAGLRREARLGGLLRHPNLVDVYEVGELDGTWFLALERCDGSLAKHLPLPADAVVDVGLQVCAALQYAHETLGLVHLDLKPSNLLHRGPIVKVADLGLATAEGFDRDDRARRGTPRYMAPEQRVGGAVDARTDVYALGRVLAKLATGSSRIAAPTVSLDDDDDDEAAPAPSRVPPWLEDIVARCTAERPEDRFSSAAALAAALRDLDVTGPGLAALWPEPLDPSPTPTRPVPLIGRDAELAALAEHLARPGVVTLKGLGGIGKTRLAREGAERFDGPTWFVELAATSTRSGLLMAVAAALDMPPRGTNLGALAAQVGNALHARGRALLVLDNHEHLHDHVDLAQRWAKAAPRLRILVTSRRPLRITGERLVEVMPLARPDAIRLLVERARARGAEVAEDPAVPELARRLDGVPLALELAAGRLGVLTPSEVLQRLELPLLRAGETSTARHVSLEAALQWSWEQLREPARQALASLSVFQGPFPIDAAEAVLAPDGSDDLAVLDVLDDLVESSLVADDGERLSLLQPVRQFADQQLRGARRAQAEDRHARWFVRYGRDGFLHAIDAHGGLARFQQLRAALDDIRAAHARAVESEDGTLASALALAAGAFYTWHGPAHLGVDLVDQALALPEADRARLLHRRASLRRPTSPVEALDELEEARALFAAQGDTDRILACRITGVTILTDLDRYDEARAELRAPDPPGPWGGTRPLWEAMKPFLRANIHRDLGEVERARAHNELALSRATRTGQWRVALAASVNLANALADLGEVDRAMAVNERALAQVERTGLRSIEAVTRANIALLGVTAGAPDRAFRELRKARRLCRRWGQPRNATRMALYEVHLRTRSGHWDEAWVALEEARTEAPSDDAMASAVGGAHVDLAIALGRDEEAARVAGETEVDRLHRARLASHLGHHAEARTLLETGEDALTTPEWVELGRVLVALGEWEAAEEALDHALARPFLGELPALAEALRGRVRQALGRSDEARADVKGALARPAAPLERLEVLLVASRVERDAGHLEAARALAAQLELPPEAPLARALVQLHEGG